MSLLHYLQSGRPVSKELLAQARAERVKRLAEFKPMKVVATILDKDSVCVVPPEPEYRKPTKKPTILMYNNPFDEEIPKSCLRPLNI